MTVHLSESGKYQLEILTIPTGPHTWSLTQGVVTRVADGAIVATIDRNYSAFPFLFIEDESREWLVCGRRYTAATFVDLKTGAEVTHELGFCWADYTVDGDTLIVEGCHWGGPYEYKFYDISNPFQALVEIKRADDGAAFDIDDLYVDNDNNSSLKAVGYGRYLYEQYNWVYLPTGQRERELEIDRMEAQDRGEEPEYICYDEESSDEEKAKWQRMTDVSADIQVANGLYHILEVRKSDYVLDLEQKQREAAQARKDLWATETAASIHLARIMQFLKASGCKPSLNMMYQSRNDRRAGDDNRFYFLLSVEASRLPGGWRQWAEMKWGVDHGEFQLTVHRGRKTANHSFSRSDEGAKLACLTLLSELYGKLLGRVYRFMASRREF